MPKKKRKSRKKKVKKRKVKKFVKRKTKKILKRKRKKKLIKQIHLPNLSLKQDQSGSKPA